MQEIVKEQEEAQVEKEAEAEGITMGGEKHTLDIKPMEREYDGSMFG